VPYSTLEVASSSVFQLMIAVEVEAETEISEI